VYGDASVLYAGSIGVGTATGLFEASGVMLATDDMGNIGRDDLGPPIDNFDMGAGGGPGAAGGCGCGIVPATGAAAWGLVLVVVFARLLFRRRGAPARRRA